MIEHVIKMDNFMAPEIVNMTSAIFEKIPTDLDISYITATDHIINVVYFQ